MSSTNNAIVNPEPEDEVDFMSDAFLEQCTKNDVRPGLLHRHQDKVALGKLKAKTNAQAKQNSKALKTIEQQRSEEAKRDIGLKTEIGADNKGFQMLTKMGFEPGTTLGKAGSSANTRALKEPIPIKVKRGRGCLGVETVVEEKKKKLIEMKKKFEELSDPELFRSRLFSSTAHKEIQRDLGKAQSVCRNLDLRKNLDEPLFSWYWPKPEPKKELENPEPEFSDGSEDEEPEEEIPEPASQLDIILKYLRETYHYCLWCGAEFDDKEDLSNSCPGLLKEDH